MTRLHAPTPRRRWAAALAVAALATLAACGGTTEASDPPPTPTFTTATPSATPTKPTWAAKYTDAQYADYLAALARYQDYQAHNMSFYNPPDPVKAKKVIDEYFNQTEGLYQLKVVHWAHDHHLRSNNKVQVLWTKMTHYGHTVQGYPQVTMRQCVDTRLGKTWRSGRLLRGHYKTPIINQVTLGETPPREGSRWVITQLLDAGNDELGRIPCQAE